MRTRSIMWMVLARDVSGTISVRGAGRLAAALVLDVDTGLVRGAAIEESTDAALRKAISLALTKPAADLPPVMPGRVLTASGLADQVRTALAAAGAGARVVVEDVAPGPEAEDIFDSFVGHMGGRTQPTDFPSPDDWSQLIEQAGEFRAAEPWSRWSDEQDLAVEMQLPEGTGSYIAVVMGQAGIQLGLALYPGKQLTRGVRESGDRGHALPVGTLLFLLEPTGEVPREMADKAIRYGWPDSDEVVPVFIAFTPSGPAEIGGEDAHRLVAGMAAVLAMDRRALVLAGGERAEAVPSPAPRKASSRRAEAASTTTRLRVRMRDVVPLVERIVDVPATITLDELHDVLQVAIGWTDSHLHRFDADTVRYAEPHEDGDSEDLNERGVRLSSLPARFVYDYDFGDNWKHDIEVVGPGGPEPGCVGGEGACPPEDCGGSGGYAHLLEVLANGRDPDFDEMSRWVGNRLRPFDVAATDAKVRAVVGQVPESVRLLLDLLADGVKLTPGGRLPRVIVRAVQQQRPGWYSLGRPASIEEDLPPLSVLHEMLRRVGVLRLAKGVLRPTKAARDDREVLRRIRSWFEDGSFDLVVAELIVGLLVARGPMGDAELATAVFPWIGHGWRRGDDPLTEDDVRRHVWHLSAELEALDMAAPERQLYAAGPSALTVLPRVALLAEVM